MPATIVALAENTLQTLNRLVSVLRGRAFRILSVTPGRTSNAAVASMTIVVDSTHTKPDRVVSCLEKLDEVLQINEVPLDQLLCRELALFKVARDPASEGMVESLRTSYGARVIDHTRSELTVEIAGDSATVDNALELLGVDRVLEFVRVGPVAISKSVASPD